jgi:hypothetical protein
MSILLLAPVTPGEPPVIVQRTDTRIHAAAWTAAHREVPITATHVGLAQEQHGYSIREVAL